MLFVVKFIFLCRRGDSYVLFYRMRWRNAFSGKALAFIVRDFS